MTARHFLSMPGMAGLALALVLGLPAASSADHHASPPNVGSVWKLTPKDGVATADFEAAMKEHMAWRREAGDPRVWQVFTAHAGEDLDSYFIRFCCFRWADQDAYVAWARENGSRAAFDATLGTLIDGFSHRLQVMDLENSNVRRGDGPMRYVSVTTWTPKPEKEMQLYGAIGRMSTLAKEKDWPYQWFWYRDIGTDGNLNLAIPYASFAAMEPPEKTFIDVAAEQLGQEGAMAMLSSFNESFWNSRTTVYLWREDLSMAMEE